MYNNKIGVMVDSFKLGIKDGIKKAAEIGANGLQIYAVSGEMMPEKINKEKRRELLNFIKSKDLVVSALCGDLGGHGFSIKENNPEKIKKSKEIIDLAVDLETKVVTTHIGVIPSDPEHDRYKVLQNACEELGEYAATKDRYFAIETGPEKTEVLRKFLESLNTDNIKVNYDPANLVMVTGEDPVKGVYNLEDYIIHTHAKDGIRKKAVAPENIYNKLANENVTEEELFRYFVETPLGSGDVDFEKYLNALKDIGYQGFLTIEREVGENPVQDISQAVKFLRNINQNIN